MLRENTNDLLAFMAVARERSFTRAAAKLGVSRSALSHTIRNLEERLGLRLLARTTRSVGLTEAGARLLDTIAPRFDEIEAELVAMSSLRTRPAGSIRITATEHPTYTILWPRVSELLRQYPDIKIEIVVDYGLRDIVAERFDAGVRVGESIARDMIAVALRPDGRHLPRRERDRCLPLHDSPHTRHAASGHWHSSDGIPPSPEDRRRLQF